MSSPTSPSSSTTSSARQQFTFKMAPAGHNVVKRLQDRVERAGHKRPNQSDVGRTVFAVVLNDPAMFDKVFAQLCRDGVL